MGNEASTVSYDPEDRFTEAVASFEEAHDAGLNPDREKWLVRYADVAKRLRQYFADRERIQRQAEPLLLAAPVGALPRPFGAYELLEEIGRGAMGVVYKARQVNLKREVAVKVILAGGHAGPDELARFQVEAEAIARLQHPHIVQIFEVGEHEGQPFLVLEFCPGGSLADRLDGTPRLPLEAARLVEQLARAVHAAHAQKLVHRDLKPANVLVAAEGALKVSDFGLAKRLDATVQTMSGAVVGTPSYMAPEQARGHSKKVGPAADIYALGAILYELLTGHPPFRAANPTDTLLQVIGDDPVPPRRLQPKLPRDLETICLKCLEKAPQRRYPSARVLADDLGSFQRGEPIQARPITLLGRVARWVRRRPLEAALLTLAALALGVMLVGGWLYTLDLRAAWEKDQRQIETINGQKTALGLAREKDQDRIRTISRQINTIKGQLDTITGQSETIKEERDKLQLQVAVNDVDRGLSLCEQGDVRRGLLHLVRGLKSAPADAEPLRLWARRSLDRWQRHIHHLTAIVEYPDQVEFVGFGPDGKTLLAHTFKDLGPVWEISPGKQLKPWHPFPRDVVAFSHDGKAVLTSNSKEARVWDVETGKPLGPPLPRLIVHAVRKTALSLDAKRILIPTNDGFRLCDTTTGKPIGPLLKHEGQHALALFSPDGKVALTANNWGGSPEVPGKATARLWDAASGKSLGIPLRQEDITGGAFSPDGKILVLAGMRNRAYVWEVATGKRLGEPLQHQGPRWSTQMGWVTVAFSPDGKTVLTGGADGTARLWNVATRKPLEKALRHEGQIAAAAFSPDGKLILTGSFDRSARLWEVATGKPVGPALMHRGFVSSVAFSPDGTRIATGSYYDRRVLDRVGEARVWEVAVNARPARILRHEAGVVSVACSPDGKRVLTTCADFTARLWDASTGKPLGISLLYEGPPRGATFSTAGQALLGECLKAETRLWDVASNKLLARFAQGPVDLVVFSRNGKRVFTASASRGFIGFAGSGQLRELPGGRYVSDLAETNVITAAAFSTDSEKLVTSGENNYGLMFGSPQGRGQSRLFEATTGKVIEPRLAHQDWVFAVAFSSDGKRILTGSAQTAQAWDVARGAHLGPPLRHQGNVVALAFSPNANTVLTGSSDGTARLWQVPSGSPIGLPLRHDGSVISVAFSSDGTVALTVGLDGTARLWDAATAKPLGPPLRHDGPVNAATFSPDGKTVLTAGSDKVVRFWAVPRPIAGDVDRLHLWVQLITEAELDEMNAVRLLDTNTWRQRQQWFVSDSTAAKGPTQRKVGGAVLPRPPRPAEAPFVPPQKLPPEEGPASRALKLYCKLVGDHLLEDPVRQDLARSLFVLGNRFSETKRVVKSEQAYRASLDLYRALPENHRMKAPAQHTLGGVLNNLALILRDRGELAEARTLLEEAVRCQRRAVSLNSRDPGYQRFLRTHYRALSDLYLRLNDHAKAMKTAAELIGLSPADSWQGHLFAARIAARCCASAAKDTGLLEAKRNEMSRTYPDRSLEYLREAVRRGYRDAQGLRQPEFAPLSEREEFRRLVAELDQKSRPKGKGSGGPPPGPN
jgi:WD40 repeat protein